MGKKAQKVLDVVNEVVLSICEVILVVMVAIIFMQIVSRAFIGSSFSWTEELARFLFIALVLLGAGVLFGTRAHIAVDLIYEKVGPKGKKWLIMLTFCVVVVIAFILCVKGFDLSMKTMIQKSPALQLPVGLFNSALWIGAALMIANVFSFTTRHLSGQINDKGEAIVDTEAGNLAGGEDDQ